MNQPIARRLAPAAILALTAVTAHAQGVQERLI
jgi:hypothetical protein